VLARASSADDARRLRSIESELARLEAPRIASRITRLIAAAVALHESQHACDRDGGKRAVPAPLAAALRSDADGSPGQLESEAQVELPAYLSNLAHERALPHFVLWDLVAHAYRPSEQRSGRSFVAALVDGLAGHDGAELASAATTVWFELYHTPLGHMSRREWKP
jgi:hypothetical protein